jgi:alpha-galactosidase
MARGKVVGKSSGYKGPVTAYACNAGSVGKKRIVFIGASYKFVHRVVRDMILVKGFEDVDLVLHDIDRVPLKIVGDLVERIARQQKTRMRVIRTLDRRAALKGADVVVLSITTGGRESDFRSVEVCAKYGIPVGVGDTMGPPALARNLRTIPVVLEMIRDMEELCPSAVMLNFTNPMSALTGAMARRGSIPVWGLCHSGDAQFEYFAAVFGVKKAQVRIDLAGVNHQAFVTRLRIKGRDRTKEMLAASLKSGARVHDTLFGSSEEARLQQDVCRLLGVWPSCGAGHLAEFYRHFFTPRRIEALGLDHEVKRLIPGRQPFGRTPCPQILKEWAYGPEKVGDLHLMTSEHAHELMWAFLTGEPCTRSLNVLNTEGYVQDVDRNACVEIMATVAGRAVKAAPTALPRAALTLVQQWTAIHDLSIRAASGCDRDAARQALFLDPHVGDAYDIAPLLEDLLAAGRHWLPRKWFAP